MRLDRHNDEFDSFAERDGELALPDDLAMMAEQLADDAQRLAACYPPQYGPVIEVAAAVASARSHANARGRVWLAGSLASGLLALGLAAALLLGERTPQPADGSKLAGDPQAAERDFPLAANVAPEPMARELVVPAAAPDVPLQVTPAVFERGVTSPEMEGWLDLAMDTESIEF